MISKNEILEMHLGGKIGVELLRELETQRDLSIAYTPSVAEVCKVIESDSDLAYRYTSKGNTVAIATDGTAVLGLGNIGAAASIPVMEGKAVLFKRFGEVDAWPICVNYRDNGKTDVEKFIDHIASETYYGGINLEDIAAPACFEIEDRLDAMLDIPVFHDDQWGTAIITLAGVKNYCILSGKAIQELNIVINGAGAAGIRIGDMLTNAGAKNIVLVDSKGVIHSKRSDLNEMKKKYAAETSKRTLEDAMKGADLFIGVSVADCVTRDMIKSMHDYPAVFAMANPNPEIKPADVMEVMGGKPYIMATGRSDYPNQINNVLGFPYIFRGALDVRASTISIGMKEAAADALAELAMSGNVPESVQKAYQRTDFDFGPGYIIPVPFDPRLLGHISSSISRAALREGLSVYAKNVSGSDQYHAPEMTTADSARPLIRATIKDQAYSDGKCYIGISPEGEDCIKYIPCGDNITIAEDSQKDTSKDAKFNPQEEPGKLFRLTSKHIGQERMLSLSNDKTLGAIAF